jgi:TatA/E family protein of Tat protein translocase
VPGFAEWVVILFVVMFVFAAGKLPEIATSLGRALMHLRQHRDQDEGDDEEKPPQDPDPQD